MDNLITSLIRGARLPADCVHSKLICWSSNFASTSNWDCICWQTLFCCSGTQSCLTLWDPMDCGTTGLLVLYYLLEFAQNHVHCVDDATQPSHSLSPPSLLASTFSSIRVISNELALCIRRPKDWRFSFSISPSSDYLWLIFLRIDWYDIFAVQGNLKRFLQHHTLKASILWC